MLVAQVSLAMPAHAVVTQGSATNDPQPQPQLGTKADHHHPHGFVPHVDSPKAPARVNTASTNPVCPGCNPPLLFSRGYAVMGGLTGTPGHVTITPIYWAPTGFSYGTATYKTIVNGYLQNVAQASGQSTNVFSVSTQYYQQANAPGSPQDHIQYVIAAGPEVDDDSAYPAQGGSNGCTAAAGFTACITDGALQSELQSLLQAKGLPADDSHLYLVFFPTGVETCTAPTGTTGVLCSDQNYCAYHSSTNVAPWIIYGNQPMPSMTGCVDPVNGAQAPNGDPSADAQVSLVSHEANEAITDWAGTWMDSAFYENGDECAYVYGTPQGTPGAYYNQVIGTGHYYTQDEFSNADFALGIGDSTGSTQVKGCVQQEELPTASFTGPATVDAGTSASFDGSASSDPDSSAALTYSWSWGDGTGPGSGAKPSHLYCSPGIYTITLTVTDIDGWKASASSSITAVQHAPTVTGIAPSSGQPAGGATVTITGCALTGLTAVHFGAAGATFTPVSDTQARATSPPVSASGTVDVTVTTSGGTSATTAADRFTYTAFLSYFNWFDKASGGMLADNIHLLNPGSTSTDVTVSIPGAIPVTITVGAKQEAYTSFPQGTIGGPVTVSSNQAILASQRVEYNQSFNEVAAQSQSQASTTIYINWYDKASPGMFNDNIHVLNPGSSTANVTVSLPGAIPQQLTVAPGAESFASFPKGTIGGPVTVTSDQPVLASQRVQFQQTFNEVWAQSQSRAATANYINWFDKASPGMLNDNIHILNPGGTVANVTVSLPGAVAQVLAVAPGQESYASFPQGTIGGPVTVTSDQPVLASQRVQFQQSFNEVWAEGPGQAVATSYVNWFDKSSPGMLNDNIHVLNPGTTPANVAISLPGSIAQQLTVAPGAEAYATFPPGTIGGPVTITSDQPVLASQRVQFEQTFNEVWAIS